MLSVVISHNSVLASSIVVVVVVYVATDTGVGAGFANLSETYSYAINELLLTTSEELYFTNCKREIAAVLVHQYFHSVEVDIDADITVTCWLSTWWD